MANKNYMIEEPETEEEYEIAIAQLLAEMQKMRTAMDGDQEDAARREAERVAYKTEMAALRAETRAMLNNLNAMLLKMNETSTKQRLH